MLLRIQRHIDFDDYGYELCYRIARKALSDRPWHLNVDHQSYVYIPVMESERYIIDFILKTLVHAAGFPELEVYHIYDGYSIFRSRHEFIETNFSSEEKDGILEIIPPEKEGKSSLFNITDLKDYPGLDFETSVSFEEFLRMDQAIRYKGPMVTDEEIARLARSIIRSECPFQEDQGITTHAYIRNRLPSGETQIQSFYIGILIQALRRAIPIIKEFAKTETLEYPVEAFVAVSDRYPSEEVITSFEQYPKEEDFNTELINLLRMIGNSMETSVPVFLIGGALHYLREAVDHDVAEELLALFFCAKESQNNTIFLSKGHMEFNAIAAAMIFRQMVPDVDSVRKMVSDSTIDHRSLILSLEIGSALDPSSFYMFIREIIRQGDKLGFDVRPQISTFLLDDDKIDDFERNTAMEIIKESKINVEDAKMKEPPVNALEDICENVEIGSVNTRTLKVDMRIEKKFSIIDKDEVISITFERGMLSDDQKKEETRCCGGADPYGLIDKLSEAINRNKKNSDEDVSLFKEYGKEIGSGISKIYSDLGSSMAAYIYEVICERIIIKNIGFADIEAAYCKYISEYVHLANAQCLFALTIQASYKKEYDRCGRRDMEAALILLAAASEKYSMENSLLDWIHFALNEAFGISIGNIKENLDSLIKYMDYEQISEAIVNDIINSDDRTTIFISIFDKLTDDNNKYKEWFLYFDDAAEIAHMYLKNTIFTSEKNPGVHEVLCSSKPDETRLQGMVFLENNREYRKEEIILITAWTLPWMDDVFGPVMDKLKDETAIILGTTTDTLEDTYFDFQTCAKMFEAMYQKIGLDAILDAMKLTRDSSGRAVTTDINKFRILAVKSIVDSDPIPESNPDIEDIDKVIKEFFAGKMDEYNYLYDAMKMICG